MTCMQKSFKRFKLFPRRSEADLIFCGFQHRPRSLVLFLGKPLRQHQLGDLQTEENLCLVTVYPGGNPGVNLKSTSHRCYLFEIAFVWALTKETMHLPLGCLQGGTGHEWEFRMQRAALKVFRCKKQKYRPGMAPIPTPFGVFPG